MGKIANTIRTWALPIEQKRQLLAFDAELDQADEKVRLLEAQVLDLEKKVNPLEREVERLEKRVEEEGAKAARAAKLAEHKASKRTEAEEDHLAEQEVTILKMLGWVEINHKRGVPLSTIAETIKVNELRVKVILRGLRDRQYIWFDDRPGGNWKLNNLGQEYLVKHNLDDFLK
jgi:predicted RNase H-like nuclease (RuvC/YqgF family)